MGALDNMFGWDKLSWPKKVMIGLPIAGAVIGWMYYDKAQQQKETHEKMLVMCEGDAACVKAVNEFADQCFADNYHMGRRRQGVRTEDFVNCVNEKSGAQHFVVDKSK